MGGRISMIRQHELGYSVAHELPRDLRMLKNAYMYDQSLYPLGCGDIGHDDPSRYATLLQQGELLVALPSHQRDPYNANKPIDAAFAARSFGLLIVPRCVFMPGIDGGIHNTYPTLSANTAQTLIASIQQQ